MAPFHILVTTPGYVSLHMIIELLSVQCLHVNDVIPIILSPAVGSLGFPWWHYDVTEWTVIIIIVWPIYLCFTVMVCAYSHLYKSIQVVVFSKVTIIGIISLTWRHCTQSNSIIMCSDSYPIPILSLFFLYHSYIPYF